MTTLNRQQARNVDQHAIDKFGISGQILMENAGRACTDVIEVQPVSSVILLCGKGNNAGDGFVIARHLLVREIPAITILLVPPEKLTGDAKTNFDILSKLPATILFATPDNFGIMLQELNASGQTAVLDCMMGTGGQGTPRSPFDIAINWANQKSVHRIAIDIPTGLDCDTGELATPTFLAHQTLTMVAPKQGFTSPTSKSATGDVIVVDIGIPLKELL